MSSHSTTACLRGIDEAGERWTFAIRSDRSSKVSNSLHGAIGTLSLVAVKALMAPGQSAAHRAKSIIETFNLVVLTATKKNIDACVMRKASSQLARKIAASEEQTAKPAMRRASTGATSRNLHGHQRSSKESNKSDWLLVAGSKMPLGSAPVA